MTSLEKFDNAEHLTQLEAKIQSGLPRHTQLLQKSIGSAKQQFEDGTFLHQIQKIKFKKSHLKKTTRSIH